MLGISFSAMSSTKDQDKNWFELFQAARKGQIKEVKILLGEVKKPIWLGSSTFPHIIIGCKSRNHNQLSTIKLLAEAGVDFNKNDKNRDSLMANSMCKYDERADYETNLLAQANTIDIAKFLIATGADAKRLSHVSSKVRGLSAFSYAITNKNEPLAIYLSKYSDITKSDMRIAKHNGMGKLISSLITNGFDYSEHDLLRWAIHDSFNGIYHEEVLINLLNDGLDPNKFIVEQRYYSHPIIHAVYENNLNAIKTLQLYGARTDVTDRKGRSLHDIAKRQKNNEIIEHLKNF